ncbi:MAG: hypothetical protein ACKN92_01760 [Candidatus Nanopelagicaceae bacterium]
MKFIEKRIRFIVVISVVLAFPLNFATADSKEIGSVKKGSASAKPANTSISTSIWISPTIEKNDNSPNSGMIAVNPGSAISLKFRVFNNSSEIKDVKGIEIKAIPASCLDVSPTPSPSATFLENTSPGKSKKPANPEIRFNQAGFNLLWKTSKMAVGCFQFKVNFKLNNTNLLTSPTFVFRKL